MQPELQALPAPQALREPLEQLVLQEPQGPQGLQALRAIPVPRALREPPVLRALRALPAPQGPQALLATPALLAPLARGLATPALLALRATLGLQGQRAPLEQLDLQALQAIPARRALLVRAPEILAPLAIPELLELLELQELQGLRVIPEPLGPLGLRAPPEQREILALPGLLARQARQATLGPLDRLARPVRLGLRGPQAIRAQRGRLFIPALVWLFRTALLGSRLSLRPQVRSSAPQTRRR